MVGSRSPVTQKRPLGHVLHLASVRWWSALAYTAFALAQGLDRIGVPGGIVTPPETPLDERASAGGLLRTEWRDLFDKRPDRALRAIARLKAGARDGSVAAVFVHTGEGHLPAALALRGGPAPLLRVRADIRRPGRSPLHNWLYTRATDRILISGEFMRSDYFDDLRIAPRRIVHLPAGFDTETIRGIDREKARARLRAAQGWSPDAPVVGMLARYSPVKGHRDLVAAARLLGLPAARYLSAGPDGQVGRATVQSWVDQAGLGDRFAVLGESENPLELAAGLDVAVIASIGSEAVCRSALEYMSLGVPIVATRVHVIPETLGDAGVLVDANAPEQIADALGALLRDPVRAGLLGQAGACRIQEEFDLRRIAERALAVIEAARREDGRCLKAG